ncbi:hypothetical protein VR5_122 [Escherichia phage vb_EcoM-VR5]|uniref:Uncharacterized protein n=1 Tax=Escherichia phage vb_EcoM-VR5 TaxID=1567026 RepID=A0A0A7HF78_9CAUD|nr:membrane protein [Escherichia phage vb_EcoM-VR5]AIZ01909.1 hypothetical protein VR5_122 [Escherichia phage vb_EcoM-VR5]
MALYEPGCMGLDVNFVRRSENAGIIVPSGENMVIKKSWRNLDDGDEGIAASTVDWSHCNRHMKELLIEEYKMGYIVNGWQPAKKITRTDDKYICFQDGKAKLIDTEWLTFGRYVVAYLITLLPMLVLSSFLIDVNWNDALERTIIGAGLMNLFTAGVALSIWCLAIEMPWRLRRQQRLYDEGKTKKNLNDFIEECRK